MVTVSSNYQSSVLRGGPGRPQQSPNHPGQKRDRLAAGLTHPSGGRPVLPTESDSLNENTFPSVPVHRERDREHKTKRKRKCKRFALDPEQQGTSGKPTYPVNSHGRSFTGYSFVHPGKVGEASFQFSGQNVILTVGYKPLDRQNLRSVGIANSSHIECS